MIELAFAPPERYAEVAALLDGNGLPSSDLDPARVTLLVALEGDAIVGAIGLEASGGVGLVRSLVTAPERRGRGLAPALYAHILDEARRRGLGALYVLTSTAEAFFRRRGFTRVERDQVPEPIRATPQFRSLCPASATVLGLGLG
jgi:amino-acid N-acetyltransferase